MKNRVILFLTIALIALFVQLPASAGAADDLSALSASERSEHLRVTSGGSVFIVNSIGDIGDANTNDEICDTGVGECTLRAAIEEADSDNDHDIIRFSFTSSTLIEPTSPLPQITNSITIDGVTGNAAHCPTSSADTHDLFVTLSGEFVAGSVNGLRLGSGADDSVIRGLNIIGWEGYGITLFGQSSFPTNYLDNVSIQCNVIGSAISGSEALLNRAGVAGSTVQGLMIGGESVADRNVIAGNRETGIFAGNIDSYSSVTILGNYIGTTLNGGQPSNTKLSNGYRGIFMIGYPEGISATVGSLNAPNIISHNGKHLDLGGGYRARGVGLFIEGSFPVWNSNPPVSITYNTFENNTTNGLTVIGIDNGNFRHNTFFENGDFGIEAPGIKPTILSVSPTGLVTARILNLPFLPGRTFTIDIYESDQCDNVGLGAGFGQGQRIVGSLSVVSFEVEQEFTYQLPTIPADGTAITMLASDSSYTSMFSNCGIFGQLTFTVDLHLDDHDGNLGDSLCRTASLPAVCTLRAAIEEINALPSGNSFRINFAITNASPIQSSSALPTIHKQVFIDGTTSPNATCPTDSSAATGLVRVRGATNWMGNGLVLGSGSDGSTIQGLDIGDFYNGENIQVNSDHNRIQCNYIGGSNPDDIGIGVTGNSNTIGGLETWQRNVIVRNSDAGIELSQTASVNNILGNYIGTDGTSAPFLHNGYGIRVLGSGTNNNIGGQVRVDENGDAVEFGRNLISNNTSHGIHLNGTGGNNKIGGNDIGVDASGNPLGNGDHGILVESPGTWIGWTRGSFGLSYLSPNVVGANGQVGIYVTADDALIEGNFVGVGRDGVTPIGNTGLGMFVTGDNTRIIDNVISDNGQHGLRIDSDANELSGNMIGVAADGTTPRGNSWIGLLLNGESNIVSDANIVAYSGDHGIYLNPLSRYVQIEGNAIHHNVNHGIVVNPSAIQNNFFSNSIYANGKMAIDNNDDGIMLVDDFKDADTGGNQLMNRPNVVWADANTGVINTVFHGAPKTIHYIEFYANSACSRVSPFDEGLRPIKIEPRISFETGDDGDWQGMLTIGGFITGEGITALVTNTYAGDAAIAGSTSEFSDCETATGATPTAITGVQAGRSGQPRAFHLVVLLVGLLILLTSTARTTKRR